MGNMREEAERLIRQAQQQAQQQAEAARQQQDFQEQQAREAELQERRQAIEKWKTVSQGINQAVVDSNAVALLKELQRDLWQGKGEIITQLASISPYTHERRRKWWIEEYYDIKTEYPLERWLDLRRDPYSRSPYYRFEAYVGKNVLCVPRYNSASVELIFEFRSPVKNYRSEGANSQRFIYLGTSMEKGKARLNMVFSENTINTNYVVRDPRDSIDGYTFECELIPYSRANMQSAKQEISLQLARLHADAFIHKATPPQLHANHGLR